MNQGICLFPDCDKPHYTQGYCTAHYQQRRRTGRMKPLRTERGQASKLQLCLSQGFRDLVRADAELLGISEPDWWRRAAEAFLARNS